MTDDLKHRFQQILSQRRGLANAIQVRELAVRLDTSERLVRSLKRELADEGLLIGSSCDARCSGYYLPETSDEIQATLLNYEARLRSLAKLIRATKGAAGFSTFLEQLSLELEEQQCPS